MINPFKNNEIPLLETEQYLLRGLSLGDAAVLFEFMSVAETMKYVTPHPIISIREMEEKIKGHLANFENEKEIPWVIIEKRSGAVIGMFRLHKVHMWHRKAEMGAYLHQHYHKKGVMTEVMNTILPFVFNELELNRLVGDIFAENQGSKKLLEKYGFHQDGILRQTDFDGTNYHDTVVYSLLKEEYQRDGSPGSYTPVL